MIFLHAQDLRLILVREEPIVNGDRLIVVIRTDSIGSAFESPRNHSNTLEGAGSQVVFLVFGLLLPLPAEGARKQLMLGLELVAFSLCAGWKVLHELTGRGNRDRKRVV